MEFLGGSIVSFIEETQSRMEQIPHKSGQFLMMKDTGNLYRDLDNGTRIPIGDNLNVVDTLPSDPISAKLYLVKPDKLYVYLGEWVCLNVMKDIDAKIQDNACKNLFNVRDMTSIGESYNVVDSDDFITANGSAQDSDNRLWKYNSAQWKLTLSAGSYIFRCETKCSSDNTNARIEAFDESDNRIFIDINLSEDGAITSIPFTLTKDTLIGLVAKIYKGSYRFMIQRSSIADETYEPYYPTVKKLYETSNSFSTTEKMVGSWINGKSIYQKTIDCGNLLDSGTKKTNHGLSIGTICSVSGVATNGTYTLPLPYASDSEGGIRLAVSDTTVDIETYDIGESNFINRSQFHAYITIQYTKKS